MNQFVHNFLQDEDRAARIVINGVAWAMVVVFALAVAAVRWMK